MVHEQNFSVERIVLDFESEVMRGPGSIPTGATFCHLNFYVFMQ